ncbi:unnamed protein product [Pseudo-nitzschia multistriata]|uniref:Uncharacterized protein n=1 Tax=Pseudo-nitzschia multistriata TaxID=183589 RepID=A0A448Z490_9STRA|nr:unnamed protein product [Pseudo-nitzschia multistriata]
MKFTIAASALSTLILPFMVVAEPSCTPCPEPYANLMFWELSSDAVVNAEYLGFTSEAWNAGMESYATMLEWDDLEEYQKSAANLLFGCTSESEWNCEIEEAEMSPTVDPPTAGNCMDIYRFVEYGLLPADVKEAARELAYTADAWNAGLDTFKTSLYDWDDLNPDEQEAAHVLGCPLDGGDWDGAL